MSEKRRFPIRLPEELFDRLAEIAHEEGRSVNNLIQYILRRWLEQRTGRSDDKGPKA
ncbi:MAG TPA: Arc family DNA-binding protein [Chloroflexota bacterium]